MADTTIINKFGKLIGWNEIKLNLLGRDVEGITEIEYDDELEIENIYGAGRMPIGEGEGNYNAKASITLMIEEQLGILESLPPGKRIQDIPAFPISVTYEVNGKVFKDRIKNVRIKNNGRAVKQNDKTIAFKYDLKVSHISWNV